MTAKNSDNRKLKKKCHVILFCGGMKNVPKREDLSLYFLDYKLDDVLEAFSLSALTIDAFWSPNHKTVFNFALLCLWNVQIQFQFWCWLS